MSGCSWPEPELSIGSSCDSIGDLGKYRCWEVREDSPAQHLWSSVSPLIVSLLQDQLENLDIQNMDLMVEIFMIGQAPENANPTILFSCQSQNVRQRAMGLVNKSSILEGYPGVLMAECFRRRRPLAMEETTEVPSLPPGVYAIEPLRHCGVSVLISGEHRGSPRKATLGGIVFIAGLFYGIITLYACKQAPIDPLDSISGNNFVFYGAEKHDSGAVLSLENIPSNLLSLPATSDLDDPPLSTLDTSVVGQDLVTVNHIPPKEPPATCHSPTGIEVDDKPRRTYLPNLEDENNNISPELGFIFVSAPERSLDWALVEIENSDLMLENISLNNRRFMTNSIYWSKQSLHTAAIHPKGFSRKPIDVDVLICTGNRDHALEGRLSSSPSFQKAPWSNTFQEFWVVTCVNGKFYDGDCGSWVVDCESGDLYGIVASGYPDTETAYIIPAAHIFDSMQSHLGKRVELSTPELWASRETEVTRVNAVIPPPPPPPIPTLERSDSSKTEKGSRQPSLAPSTNEELGPRRRSWSENSIQSTIFDTRSLHSSTGHFPKIPTHLAHQSNASSTHLSVVSTSDRFLSAGPRPRSSISGSSPPSLQHTYRPYSTTSTLQSIDSGYLNPPCNNLYVRNLPAEPSEDDLRDLYSSFPGYEGLRMKLNEPECFVQFEDAASASYALQKTDDHHFSSDDRWGIMVGYARNGVTPARVLPTQEEIELEVSISELLGAETLPSAKEAGGRIRQLISPTRGALPQLKQVTDKSQMLQEMFADFGLEHRASDKMLMSEGDSEE